MEYGKMTHIDHHKVSHTHFFQPMLDQKGGGAYHIQEQNFSQFFQGDVSGYHGSKTAYIVCNTTHVGIHLALQSFLL